MIRCMSIILFVLPVCGLAACSGGSGRECVVSNDCQPGFVCSIGSCVPMTHDTDTDTGGWDFADPGPDPGGEGEGTPHEDALEPAPDVPDAHHETDAPQDATSEEGPQPAGNIGDSCESPEDCIAGPDAIPECLTSFLTYTLAGGYCTAACSDDADCGDSAAKCVVLISYCLRACSVAEDCRVDEGYTCAPLPVSPDAGTCCIPVTPP